MQHPYQHDLRKRLRESRGRPWRKPQIAGGSKDRNADYIQIQLNSDHVQRHPKTIFRDIQITSFRHVIGQANVAKALQIAVDASFQEGKRLDETFFAAHLDLGKTSLVSVLGERTRRAIQRSPGPVDH